MVIWGLLWGMFLGALLARGGSRFRNGQPLEGVVVRRDGPMWNETRAKLVRTDFTQAIKKHWRGRSIEWNHVSKQS